MLKLKPPTHFSRRHLMAAALAPASVAAVSRAAATASGGVLTVATFPLLDQIVRAALPAWQRLQPNVEIQVINRPYIDHHTAMTTALSTAVLLPDVMALESSFVSRYAQGLGLEDLSREPYRVDRFRAQLVGYAYDQALSRQGAVVAVPTDIGPGTLLYRNDILQRAGVAADELTRSWEAYVAAGQRIKRNTGAYLIAHVTEIKDILIRTGTLPGEGLYFDQQSRVLVESPRFVRAFEIALQARRLNLDAKVVAWSNEWAEGLKRGHLATELGGAWLVGQMSNWVAAQTAGLWRAAPLPQGANTGYGGAFYAMPRRADASRKSLAWQFIQLMTLDRTQQLAAFKSHDAFPALLATHDDEFFEQPVAFLGGQKARLLWRDAARRISASPVHKQNNFADEVVGTELEKVLNRGKDIATALGDASRLIGRRALR